MRYSPVHSPFTKLKPAQSLVTGAEANTDGLLGHTQVGSSFVIGLSNRVQQTVPSAFDSRDSPDERHRPLWYVATPIDLSENFLFQRFIHQRVWMRRMFNGEFITVRNLWVAVIKFALAIIESSITHPSESKGCQALCCLLLSLAVSDAHPNVLFDSFQHVCWVPPWCPEMHYPQVTNFIHPHTFGMPYPTPTPTPENSLPYPPRLNSPLRQTHYCHPSVLLCLISLHWAHRLLHVVVYLVRKTKWIQRGEAQDR